MTRQIRIAVTETVNAYQGMPQTVARLPELANKLDDVRRANIDHHLDLIFTAHNLGAKAMGLGELFSAPYFALTQDPMWLDLAEDAATGPTITAMKEAARDYSMVLVAPIYEYDASCQKRFNTAVVIDSDGSVLGKYRKCHIPCGTNEAGSFHEPYYYERSDGNLGSSAADGSTNPYFPVFQTSVGRIGVAICYDRHFPEVMRTLAKEGAELVFSPAVTFGKKSEAMWQMEFCVDAARYNLFIAGSNKKGAEAPWNQEYFGQSYVVGPNGRIPPLKTEHKTLVLADIDLDELCRPDPSGWNLKRDRRPDVYEISPK